MIIAVSGSVCSGKTTLAKMIAEKYRMKYVDVNKLIKENKIYDSYNKKFNAVEVDANKFAKFMAKWLKGKKDLVLDSHLSHYIPAKYVDLCYITKCDLRVLRKRLEKRGYGKEKIEENVEAEIMDACLNEARELGHRIKIIDTTKGLKSSLL